MDPLPDWARIGAWALVAVAALVLTWSGVLKLRSPRPTAVVLVRLAGGLLPESARTLAPSNSARSLALPAATALGVWEVALGISLLGLAPIAPLPVIGLAALTFAGFALTAARLRSIAPSEPCGCFGASSRPVGPPHVLINGLVAAALGAVAIVLG